MKSKLQISSHLTPPVLLIRVDNARLYALGIVGSNWINKLGHKIKFRKKNFGIANKGETQFQYKR